MKDGVHTDLALHSDAFRGYVYDPSIISGIVAFVDVMAILSAAVICYAFQISYNHNTVEYYASCAVFVAFAYSVLAHRARMYDVSSIMNPYSQSDGLALCLLTAFFFFFALVFSLKVSDIYSRIWIYSFGASSFAGLMTTRLIGYYIFRRLSKKNLIGRNVVVLGAGEQGRQLLARHAQTSTYFVSIVGVFDDDQQRIGQDVEGYPILGNLDSLVAHVRERRIDDVIISLPWSADKRVAETVERLRELPVNIYLSADLAGFQLKFRPAPGHFRQLPMFEIVERPLSGWAVVAKMIEDYVLACIIAILLMPLFAVVAIAIKLDSPGPVLFRQKRLGFNNQTFSIYKFRSMHCHEEAPDARTRQATLHDPRITRVGRFIRRTSIDELPQIFNVLNGTMSLIGPRPHALDHNEDFAREVRGYFARHRVKPGLTGWAQVNGLRGETDTLEKLKARVEHDVYYIENWSILFDIRILVLTAFVVLFQKNAY